MMLNLLKYLCSIFKIIFKTKLPFKKSNKNMYLWIQLNHMNSWYCKFKKTKQQQYLLVKSNTLEES